MLSTDFLHVVPLGPPEGPSPEDSEALRREQDRTESDEEIAEAPFLSAPQPCEWKRRVMLDIYNALDRQRHERETIATISLSRRRVAPASPTKPWLPHPFDVPPERWRNHLPLFMKQTDADKKPLTDFVDRRLAHYTESWPELVEVVAFADDNAWRSGCPTAYFVTDGTGEVGQSGSRPLDRPSASRWVVCRMLHEGLSPPRPVDVRLDVRTLERCPRYRRIVGLFLYTHPRSVVPRASEDEGRAQDRRYWRRKESLV